MNAIATRARRWPLALTLVALTALSACSDDPVAPKAHSAAKPNTSAVAGDFVDVTVTNTGSDVQVGSIQWAANQIGSAGGAIHFDPSLDGATITLNTALHANGPLYIDGPTKGITLSGNDQHRVIDASNGQVSAKNVTITKGYSADYASAIRANSVYLDNSTVVNNRGSGSAIRVLYTLSLINSTISGNTVGGPALEYGQKAQVFLDNATVAYNAPGPGIGLFGPIDSGYALLVVLNNSILASNGSPLQNCLSTSGLRYEGQNISTDWSCGAVGIGIGDPLLMPLANNGGPNMTHAISHLSPAFNTGIGCYPQTDQRYVPRDAKCDVGAFEFNDFTKITITIDPATKVDATTGRALITGTVKCTRNDAFRLALELHQDQKVGKTVVDVHAASDIPVSCTTTGSAWSATMGLTSGAWQNGAARATAQTFSTPDWVTPAAAAGAVKISVARK